VLTATFADQRTLKLLQTEAHRRLWSSARIRTAFGSLAAKLGRAIEAGEMA
jgi:hypothetical protein